VSASLKKKYQEHQIGPEVVWIDLKLSFSLLIWWTKGKGKIKTGLFYFIKKY
jgi:hypothetical protein